MAEQPEPPAPNPAYVQAAERATDGLAIASLVLGILGVAGAFLYFIPALILGAISVTLGLWSRWRIRRSGGALGGSGIATAGWIVGVCAFGFGGVSALLWIGLLSAGTSGGPGR